MGKPLPSNVGKSRPLVGMTTGGTETSKYPEEEKSIRDFQSSGERNGNSLNLSIRRGGLRDRDVVRRGTAEAAGKPRRRR